LGDCVYSWNHKFALHIADVNWRIFDIKIAFLTKRKNVAKMQTIVRRSRGVWRDLSYGWLTHIGNFTGCLSYRIKVTPLTRHALQFRESFIILTQARRNWPISGIVLLHEPRTNALHAIKDLATARLAHFMRHRDRRTIWTIVLSRYTDTDTDTDTDTYRGILKYCYRYRHRY